MDPRVERTREHVLKWTRNLMQSQGPEGVTFSNVAKAARVARQTLYHHWDSREQLIAEMLVVNSGHVYPLKIEATPAAHLDTFLRTFLDLANSPGIAGAAAQLITQATTDPESAATLKALQQERMQTLRIGWGPLSGDEYALIVGPVYFQLMVMRNPVTDDFIQAIIDEAMVRRSAADSDVPPQ